MCVKEEKNHEETVCLKQFYNAANFSISPFPLSVSPLFSIFKNTLLIELRA